MQRILVVRPDRIGDFVLSLPVFEWLKKSAPDLQTVALVRDEVFEIAKACPFIDEVFRYQPYAKHSGNLGFAALTKEIRALNLDSALTLQADLNVTLALKFAGVPVSTGPRSKWFSYFLFSGGKRQRRSSVRMHEAQYNLDLAFSHAVEIGLSTKRNLERMPELEKIFPKLVPSDVEVENLRAQRISEQAFVLVHPGMGGSALNWPKQNYIEFVSRLLSAGLDVRLSGGPSELELVQEVGDGRVSPDKIHIGEKSDAGMRRYLALISLARVVVAPSTGPLHLASALGRPTVSFFPPIPVQSPARWAPLPKGETNIIFAPRLDCPAKFRCLGLACRYFDCMEKLSIDEAFEAVLKLWQR